MSIRSVMQQAGNKLKSAMRKELRDQGHYLTGDLDASINDIIFADSFGTTIEGYSLDYERYLNEGYPSTSVSWSQFPFLIEFFKKKGLEEKEAKSAAAGTIQKWMKEGVPTANSKSFSKTGERTGFIDSVISKTSPEIDKIVSTGIDSEVSKAFNKTKSETV